MNHTLSPVAFPSPPFLYGTAWKEEQTQPCVENALAEGFRGIDTANQRKHYFEAGVGAALRTVYAKGKIKREDLFLQTKFTFQRSQDDRLPYDPKASLTQQVQQSFVSSLEHLGTDFLDSYLLHGPSSSQGIAEADWEVWRAMETLYDSGKVRFLGASNMSAEQLSALYEGARVKPRFAQIRTYAAREWERETRKVCLENGIAFQGFSLLTANREVLINPQFLKIRERVGCTPSQLIFRLALHLGMLPITGTKDSRHMREDLECVKYELLPREVSALEAILLES